jgi:hypothetical protein
MLVEDSQNILSAVSKIISAKSQADAVNAASTLPDLYNNLLSCELGMFRYMFIKLDLFFIL